MTNKEFQEWLKQYPDDAEVLIENAQGNPNPSGLGRIAQGRHIK